eukprot:c10973_g1_i2.p1 GENE.c10973_g1_i2~~c10973_g1_i2.p1  ORF type:complete len:318 (+),score=73.99 c10973_g1_i2:124-1077(+)
MESKELWLIMATWIAVMALLGSFHSNNDEQAANLAEIPTPIPTITQAPNQQNPKPKSASNTEIKRKNKFPIPETVHMIWLGPRPPPAQQIETWTKDFVLAHPSWAVRVWRDTDIENFGLKNKKWFDLETDWGAKADIARYEILYRLGGVYVDADQVWLGTSLDSFVTVAEQTGLLCGRERDVMASIGVLFATPGHTAFKNAIELVRHSQTFKDQAVWFRTGPMLFTQAILGQTSPLSLIARDLVGFLVSLSKYVDLSTNVTIVPVENLICNKWYDDWKLPRKNAQVRAQEIEVCRASKQAITYDYGFTTNRLFEEPK